MPKFNLNWMYMIIALMLLGLWWGSDSKGAGSKAVTYSEFQDYVKKGYVSKVLGYEDKSIEAFLKPTAVGAVFGADSTKVGRNPVITSRTPSTDKLEEFLQAEKEAGHFDVHPTIRQIGYFPRNSDSGTPALSCWLRYGYSSCAV